MESLAKSVAASIASYKFSYKNEWELQRGVALMLTELGLEFKKEVLLGPKQRIDFLVGNVGIECKVDMDLAGVTRQLWHYADSPRIDSLILVTTRHAHCGLPLEMKGKPIFVVHLLSL